MAVPQEKTIELFITVYTVTYSVENFISIAVFFYREIIKTKITKTKRNRTVLEESRHVWRETTVNIINGDKDTVHDDHAFSIIGKKTLARVHDVFVLCIIML